MQEAQQKQWYWSPTETFNVKGEFINLTVHLLQEVLSTPEARKFALALELDKLVGDVMREGIDQGKITDSPPSNIPSDLNHYKNMSPEEFSIAFGVHIHLKKDLAHKDNQHSFELEPSEREFVLDGKYWISKTEKEILKQFEDKSIQFGYKDSETKGKYILWINTL